ncbi:DnaJ family molecular chaperone [Corallococcus sp. CA054B]|uniref:J domain-containing protein n=1 Tax=Corallococcus sp. CA054B TaxID=2316734 RepID=UPI0011C3B339|nr:hypothetical protein [Corallococcus sp. CA054B]
MSAILNCESLEALHWFADKAGVSVFTAGYAARHFPEDLAKAITTFLARRVGLAVASTATLSKAAGTPVSFSDILIFRGSEFYWSSAKSEPTDDFLKAIEIVRIFSDANYTKNKGKKRDGEVLKNLFEALKEKPRAKKETQSPPAAKAKQVDDDPHAVLGIPEDCTWTQLRAARNSLLTQYHPDKVAELGPRIREIADLETKKINAAFERLAVKIRPKGRSGTRG